MAVFPADVAYARSTSYRVSLRSLQTRFGDGYGQRSGDGINPASQIWEVTTVELDAVDAQEVEDFLVSEAGNFFDWTPPLKTDILRVSCNSYQVRHVGGSTLKRIRATFEQRIA